jgi:hypothetical protein
MLIPSFIFIPPYALCPLGHYTALAGSDLLKNQEEKHRILTHMGRVVRQVGILRNMPWLTPLVQAWPSTQREDQSQFKEFTRSMFLRRRNQGLGSQIDVFHYLVSKLSSSSISPHILERKRKRKPHYPLDVGFMTLRRVYLTALLYS